MATSLIQLVKIVEELAEKVAALELQVLANKTGIADLAISDEASGWKQWREDRKTT